MTPAAGSCPGVTVNGAGAHLFVKRHGRRGAAVARRPRPWTPTAYGRQSIRLRALRRRLRGARACSPGKVANQLVMYN